MNKNQKSTKSINLEIDTTELSAGQIRLMKSVHTMLSHIMTTEFEDEYFESSSEILRMVATAIKTANFNKQNSNIEYDKQVLEYCSDILADQVYLDDVIKYDN